MRPPRIAQRGTALVIAVGLMSVLAVVGFGFAVVMRLHYETSSYYRANSQVELLSQAAFYYASRDIRYGLSNTVLPDPQTGLTTVLHSRPVGAIADPTDSPLCPWYIGAARASGLTLDTTTTPASWRYFPLKGHSYCLVHDVLGERVALSYVKVLDSASKINLNDNASDTVLTQVLDDLFYELNVSGERPAGDSVPAIDDPAGGGTLAANTILTYRNTLPNHRFTTLAQLLAKKSDGSREIAGMTDRRYDVLQYYLTIYAWPHPPAGVQGYVPGIVKPDGSGGLVYDDNGGGGCYVSPINLNTAPYEVLVACLRQLRVPAGAGGQTPLSHAKARDVAKWILRKRDPENIAPWPTPPTADPDWTTWKQWLDPNKDYAQVVRKDWGAAPYWEGQAVNFPLGPFDSWNELADFLYSLTNAASFASEKDPFPTVLTPAEADAIAAAVTPNSFASFIPHDNNHMSYTYSGKWFSAALLVMDIGLRTRDTNTLDTFQPTLHGKNQLAATTAALRFGFSSGGRYEIAARTYAFVKADLGKATDPNVAPSASPDYELKDSTKTWGIAPAQWRGYSVLIYDGKGKGQLRGVVTNRGQVLSVAKWDIRLSTASGAADQSRYYICGPGPMVDHVDDTSRSDDDIAVTNNGAYLSDKAGTWEDDQWNGYRIVVYRASFYDQTLPSGKLIRNELIALDTVQERFIADTVGGGGSTTPRLVLSPELNTATPAPTDHWSYLILGTHGTAVHEAAIKAYDVIHHTSESDFAGSGYSATNVSVGPTYDGGTRSQRDGYLAVARDPVVKPASVTDAFVANFTNSVNPSEGGTLADSTVTIGDIYAGGNLFHDGLYIPSTGTNQTVSYNVDAAVALVTLNNTASDAPVDGGFVSFWFRPDTECLKGAVERTLLRVVGHPHNAPEGKHNDIRVQLVGTTLRLVVRSSGTAPYMELVTGASGTPPTPTKSLVKCREFTFEPAVGIGSVAVDVSQWKTGGASSGTLIPWEACQWHNIAFAWYESFQHVSAFNDDANVNTDLRCDGPAGTPNYEDLDDLQVQAKLRLWVDGIAVGLTTGLVDCNAFNLTPPASGGILQIGETGKPPSGTIDGIFAYSHGRLDMAVGVVPLPPRTLYGRYWGKANQATFLQTYATYTSPPIPLPSTGGRPVCLGTASLTLLMPELNIWTAWVRDANPPLYPCTVSVTLAEPASSSVRSPNPNKPQFGRMNEPIGCVAIPLRASTTAIPSSPIPQRSNNTTWYPILRSSSPTTIRYELNLTAYNMDGPGYSPGDAPIATPRFWQTPIVEDVTITYLGPVVFLNWK